MTKPDDIPQDVWDTASDEALKYVEWIDPPPVDGVASAEHVLAVSFARAILAEHERCAVKCEDQAKIFLSPEYATGQPLSSIMERFACEQCAAAIRKGGA